MLKTKSKRKNPSLTKKPKKRLPATPFYLLRLRIRKRSIKYVRFIFLVRHAEKENPNNLNSALSQNGLARANDLREYLSDTALQIIYISTFLRTQQTAEPTAIAKGLQAIVINQQTDDTLNTMLIEIEALQMGNILIVGHTDSLPKIIKIFCGEIIPKIEENEFNNFYTIAISNKGTKHIIYNTYGQPNA